MISCAAAELSLGKKLKRREWTIFYLSLTDNIVWHTAPFTHFGNFSIYFVQGIAKLHQPLLRFGEISIKKD